MESNELKKGTLICPNCKEKLHFEIMGTMRIVRDGFYDAYCPKDKKYFKIKSDTNGK